MNPKPYPSSVRFMVGTLGIGLALGATWTIAMTSDWMMLHLSKAHAYMILYGTSRSSQPTSAKRFPAKEETPNRRRGGSLEVAALDWSDAMRNSQGHSVPPPIPKTKKGEINVPSTETLQS